MGEIDASGPRIRAKYHAFDTEARFGRGYSGSRNAPEVAGCACGSVMAGKIKPPARPQFGRGCTPDMPLGALKVSSEEARAACWHYGGARAAA